MNSLCNKFKELAENSWDRIGFGRSHFNLRVFETTITQNLLFELIKFRDANPTIRKRFLIYESRNENRNGNDIALYLGKTRNKLTYYPMQAKVIYHPFRKNLSFGWYPSINHVVGNSNRNQIDLLINHAKSKKGLPLYLLYNYVEGFIHGKTYGCSIIEARYIKSKYFSSGKWQIPNFAQLNPGKAVPWHYLVCPEQADSFSLKYPVYSPIEYSDRILQEEYQLETFSYNELISNEEWEESQIVGPKDVTTKIRRQEDENLDFNPKFMWVITEEGENNE
ncbi:MAG: hypothetical protein IPN68_16800 [Bacteroidetes bacterium]|nr:hypothetical protein [Bacteroidota bacterium]